MFLVSITVKKKILTCKSFLKMKKITFFQVENNLLDKLMILPLTTLNVQVLSITYVHPHITQVDRIPRLVSALTTSCAFPSGFFKCRKPTPFSFHFPSL